MLAIGIILFTIGLFLLSPLDDIFILLPLSLILGFWVFPVAVFISLICLIIGAVLIGKHLLPLLENPVVLIMLLISFFVFLYVAYKYGWFSL